MATDAVQNTLEKPTGWHFDIVSVLLVAIWFISWQRLESEWEMVNRNSRVRQESLASIIAENLAQVLERGRLLALASAEWCEGNYKDATNRLQSGQSHAQSWPSAKYLAKK